VWKRCQQQVKQDWPVLLAVVVLPVPFGLLIGLLLRGVPRWILVGAVGVSGLWLATLVVVVVSGSGPILMGVQAEDWTMQELRRLRRRGWTSIAGVTLLEDADIDHIAVGPGGVLVIETKWSADRWPSDRRGSKYMERALVRAVVQARENCRHVRLAFASGIPKEHVRAVCVLWSNQASADDHIRESDGVTIVPAPMLRSWLRELEAPLIDGAQIEQVVSKLVAHVALRDAADAKRGVVYQPTVRSVLLRLVLIPLLGALGALYASLFINRASGHWQLALLSIAGLVVVGMLTLRIREVRQVALGWTLGAAFSGMVLLIIVVRAYA
jgi:hypothetical protein